MARLLVVGASRGIGLETVKAALAAGHDVVALARRAHAIPVTSPGLTRIDGDATDPETLACAVHGVDAVIVTLGTGPSLKPVLLFSKATRHLVAAMRAAGVHRLIVVTGLGAGDSRGHGGFLYDRVFFPLFLERIYEDKDVQETMVRESGLEWTIVRPGLLTSGPASGRWQALVDPQSWRAGRISRADVAAFLIAELESGRFKGHTPLLVT